MYILGKRSRGNLAGVHEDLIVIVSYAIQRSQIDFTVTEGLRSEERQKELVEAGASQTMNSRHLTGHAVDLAALVAGRVSWDWPLYDQLAVAMKDAAHNLDLKIEWGGDWKSFRDGPHFQLSRETHGA